ncbi:segregation/condensation protein A [candidate division WOR-3 bacterium]|nr:segregation/condensation protein A [candidate division WOR-3 bacterium]
MGFSVKLEIFEGPLELLLYLIRRDRLDIYDIPVSHITDEYLSYISAMRELDIEVAVDFLEMASLLMRIKARALLPSKQNEEISEPDLSKEELTQRLLVYQQFRSAAAKFKSFESRGIMYYPIKPAARPQIEDSEKFMDVIFLINAARELSQRYKKIRSLRFVLDLIPLEERIDRITDIMLENPSREVGFYEVLDSRFDKPWIIVSFMAVLELVRNSFLSVGQDGTKGKIWLRLRSSYRK